MPKSCSRGKCLVLAVCLAVVVPPLAARAEGEAGRHIAEAVRLYEDLEYELALEQLERASKATHGADDEVTIALYKGIISADMGRWAAARSAFRTALLLQPQAKLPLRVSPKVAREFESQRARAREELARRSKDSPRLAKPGPVPPEDTRPVAPMPVPAPTEPQVAVARPELVPSPTEAAPPGAELEVKSGGGLWSRRVPVVSLVLLGAGVAAGGAGAVFGLSSRSQLEDARAAQFQAELEEHHAQAQSSARKANILFGTAGVAAAGALVTWLLMGDVGADVQQGGER